MKLNIFNSWKPLQTHHRKELVYQTGKSSAAFVTVVKDVQTDKIVAKVYTTNKDAGVVQAQQLLNNTPIEQLQIAIESGNLLTTAPRKRPPSNIDWYDGANHSYRAQKRLVGEAKDDKDDDKPSFRNFVAKHARAVNKAGPMKDKKNDYKRKPKHKTDRGNE